jgi:TonB family protein
MKRVALMSCAALLICGAGGAVVTAQESAQKVKELYAAAAYEDALAAVSRIPADGPRREVEQYRVFSLTALGRHEEAQKAMEALVRADPSYALDPAETPPRVQEAFAKVQQRLLPAVTKQMYADARAALDRKERGEAVNGFEKLLKTIDSAGPGAASLGELRVLAAGFLDLSRALPEPATATRATVEEKPTVNAPSAPPAVSSAAPRPSAAGTTPPRATGDAAPAVSRGAAAAPGETRPFALSQDLPGWLPPDTLSRRGTYSGAVLVHIGTDGRVQSAEIVRPVHPTYDTMLLRAARGWRYQPATQNGKPVASELTVEVSLRPPQ